MIKLALLLKFSVVGAFALAMITTIEEIGLPHSWQLLFNGFVAGWFVHAFFGSYVGGMVRPDNNSSRRYRHFYDSMHLFFHRATSALARLSVFENLVTKDRDEDK